MGAEFQTIFDALDEKDGAKDNKVKKAVLNSFIQSIYSESQKHDKNNLGDKEYLQVQTKLTNEYGLKGLTKEQVLAFVGKISQIANKSAEENVKASGQADGNVKTQETTNSDRKTVTKKVDKEGREFEETVILGDNGLPKQVIKKYMDKEIIQNFEYTDVTSKDGQVLNLPSEIVETETASGKTTTKSVKYAYDNGELKSEVISNEITSSVGTTTAKENYEYIEMYDDATGKDVKVRVLTSSIVNEGQDDEVKIEYDYTQGVNVVKKETYKDGSKTVLSVIPITSLEKSANSDTYSIKMADKASSVLINGDGFTQLVKNEDGKVVSEITSQEGQIKTTTDPETGETIEWFIPKDGKGVYVQRDSSGTTVYVRPDDTLDTLAKDFGVSKEEIIKANGGKNSIKFGDEIKIPKQVSVVDPSLNGRKIQDFNSTVKVMEQQRAEQKRIARANQLSFYESMGVNTKKMQKEGQIINAVSSFYKSVSPRQSGESEEDWKKRNVQEGNLRIQMWSSGLETYERVSYDKDVKGLTLIGKVDLKVTEDGANMSLQNVYLAFKTQNGKVTYYYVNMDNNHILDANSIKGKIIYSKNSNASGAIQAYVTFQGSIHSIDDRLVVPQTVVPTGETDGQGNKIYTNQSGKRGLITDGKNQAGKAVKIFCPIDNDPLYGNNAALHVQYEKAAKDDPSITMDLAIGTLEGYLEEAKADYKYQREYKDGFKARWGDAIAGAIGSDNTHTYTWENIQALRTSINNLKAAQAQGYKKFTEVYEQEFLKPYKPDDFVQAYVDNNKTSINSIKAGRVDETQKKVKDWRDSQAKAAQWVGAGIDGVALLGAVTGVGVIGSAVLVTAEHTATTVIDRKSSGEGFHWTGAEVEGLVDDAFATFAENTITLGGYSVISKVVARQVGKLVTKEAQTVFVKAIQGGKTELQALEIAQKTEASLKLKMLQTSATIGGCAGFDTANAFTHEAAHALSTGEEINWANIKDTAGQSLLMQTAFHAGGAAYAKFRGSKPNMGVGEKPTYEIVREGQNHYTVKLDNNITRAFSSEADARAYIKNQVEPKPNAPLKREPMTNTASSDAAFKQQLENTELYKITGGNAEGANRPNSGNRLGGAKQSKFVREIEALTEIAATPEQLRSVMERLNNVVTNPDIVNPLKAKVKAKIEFMEANPRMQRSTGSTMADEVYNSYKNPEGTKSYSQMTNEELLAEHNRVLKEYNSITAKESPEALDCIGRLDAIENILKADNLAVKNGHLMRTEITPDYDVVVTDRPTVYSEKTGEYQIVEEESGYYVRKKGEPDRVFSTEEQAQNYMNERIAEAEAAKPLNRAKLAAQGLTEGAIRLYDTCLNSIKNAVDLSSLRRTWTTIKIKFKGYTEVLSNLKANLLQRIKDLGLHKTKEGQVFEAEITGKTRPSGDKVYQKPEGETDFQAATRDPNDPTKIAPERTIQKFGKEKFEEKIKPQFEEELNALTGADDPNAAILQKRIDALQDRAQRRELQKMYDEKMKDLSSDI